MARMAALAARAPREAGNRGWQPQQAPPGGAAAAAAFVSLACAGSALWRPGRGFPEGSRARDVTRATQEHLEAHVETQRPREPLRHVVRKTLRLPLDAPSVLRVAGDVASWSEFMPCCSESRAEGRTESGLSTFRVHFGMRVGRVAVGDSVVYQACQPSPGVLELQSLNNRELTYCDDIRCRVVAVSTADGSELHVELDFRARNRFYLGIWQQVETPLVEMIAMRLKHRAMQLAEAESVLCPGFAH